MCKGFQKFSRAGGLSSDPTTFGNSISKAIEIKGDNFGKMFSASDVIDDFKFFALNHAPTEPMEEGA